MTEDLEQRIFQHNNPISKIKYTAKGIPWQLYISIDCNDKRHALKLEKLIKAKKSTMFIRKLKEHPELREKIKNETSI
jgi:putative endonuclease